MSRVSVVNIHDDRSHGRNTHRISIPVHVFYDFIIKGLIDQVILYSQMCIRKCNIAALIFLRALNVGAGNFNERTRFKSHITWSPIPWSVNSLLQYKSSTFGYVHLITDIYCIVLRTKSVLCQEHLRIIN